MPHAHLTIHSLISNSIYSVTVTRWSGVSPSADVPGKYKKENIAAKISGGRDETGESALQRNLNAISSRRNEETRTCESDDVPRRTERMYKVMHDQVHVKATRCQHKHRRDIV